MSLGRDVAIKVLPEAVANDPERMARFEREARPLASLNHPNIAGIYGVGADEGVRFLAMELVAGDEVAVTAGPELTVSAPTLVHDFDKLRVQTLLWNVLADGRFFVGLRNENEDEITRYSLVLNWTEVLKQTMEAAR